MEGQTSTFRKLGVLKSRKYPSRSIRKKKASKQTNKTKRRKKPCFKWSHRNPCSKQTCIR